MRMRSVLLLACLGVRFAAHGGVPDYPQLQLFGESFTLDTAGLRQLAAYAGKVHDEVSERLNKLKHERALAVAAKPAGQMTLDELKRLYAEPADFVDPKERRGIGFLGEFAETLADLPEKERGSLTANLFEIADAIANNDRSPMPGGLELSFAPFILLEYMHRPIGVGRAPARNVPASEGADGGTNDPAPGTFWRRPNSIRDQDLYAGFGRSQRPHWETTLWQYHGPKTSFGNSPGFELKANGAQLKVKFWETISEPFTARIFAALGYNVDTTDHAPRLLIKYDRRLLKEFHLRKDTFTRLFRFGIPVMTIPYQTRHDPFEYISEAVLKDGRRLNAAQFKLCLFRDPEREHPEDDPANFREEFEAAIGHIVTVAANVQPEDESVKSIGPWDFNSSRHSERRELRGAGLLAAWLGWCDARFDNTRLKVVTLNGNTELRHYFSDLGGGLGKGTGFIGRKGESAEEMAWRVTRPAEVVGRHGIFRPFRIVNYAPVDDNEAFAAMTSDDARWMARLLGKLTREQIAHALAACDLAAPAIDLYAKKLISRRDQIIRDLKLDDDVPLLEDSERAPGQLSRGASD